MGINVYGNKSVAIDHTHQRLVDTSVEGNPTEGRIGNLTMTYVFRRKTSRDHDLDGNPLVYALKEMRGYTMQPMYQKMLFNRADEILAGSVADLGVDLLVDVPSSKKLCSVFAQRVSAACGTPVVNSTFLRKKTVGEVLEVIDASFPNIAKVQQAIDFKRVVGRLRGVSPDYNFEMKEVPKQVRRYFQPFAVAGCVPMLAGRRVALVDDLVSSGTSVTAIGELLRAHGAIVERSVCLFSDLP